MSSKQATPPTWHRLADHALPEPTEGATLLVRLRPRLLFTFEAAGESWAVVAERANEWSAGTLQAMYASRHPDALWFLVTAPGAKPDPAEKTDTDRLLWAVRICGDHAPVKQPRWVHVVGMLQCGPTVAKDFCRRAGVDPDEIVGGHGGES